MREIPDQVTLETTHYHLPLVITTTMTTTIDHVVEEETKIEVDCEEPTDERDMKNDTATPAAATTTTKTTSMDAASEGAAVTKDDDNGGDAVVQPPPPQIQMTVAADAPWKDRVWEGTLCVCV